MMILYKIEFINPMTLSHSVRYAEIESFCQLGSVIKEIEKIESGFKFRSLQVIGGLLDPTHPELKIWKG